MNLVRILVKKIVLETLYTGFPRTNANATQENVRLT